MHRGSESTEVALTPRKTSPGFAGSTDVPVYKSKADIEGLLTKYGAEGYHSGWQAATGDDPGWDAIEFLWKGRQIRFRIPRPSDTDPRVKAYKGPKRGDWIEQLNRQRWRVLMLVVKAKLEAVESGVSVFEEEFMPFIVTASGRTIGEILLPRLQAGEGHLQLEAGQP